MYPRKVRTKLRPDQVSAAIRSGRNQKIPDGDNLYLLVRNGRGFWVYQYRDGALIRSKGLGSAEYTTPAQARRAREQFNVERRNGVIPARRGIAARMAHPAPADAADKLFGEVVLDYLADAAPNWRGGPEGHQAISFLSGLVGPEFRDLNVDLTDWVAVRRAILSTGTEFAKLPVVTIDVDEVKAALLVWDGKPVTAERMRTRIARLLDFAKLKKLRTGDNPARLLGQMPRQMIPDAVNHPAMAGADLPAFMAELHAIGSTESRAFEWTILTAARTAETIDARWSEIVGDMWIIPKERMKGKKGKQREHRVPLTPQALALLGPRGAPDAFIFPSRRYGDEKPLWKPSMLALLHELRPNSELVVHGFRSTFRDWVSDETDYPGDLAEVALAHRVGSKTEQAYARTDMIEKRRKMMADWAAFATAQCKPTSRRRAAASHNVV